MTEKQLQAQLATYGVTPRNLLRASLYLDKLTQTKTFLTETLKSTLGDDYAFCAPALGKPNLLDELASSLDPLLMGPLNDALLPNDAARQDGITTFDAFVRAKILDPDTSTTTYAQNVATFFASYPIATAALAAVTGNFQKNIEKACQRILADRTVIAAAFPKLEEILKLAEIRTTGSDFHKGGMQVLLLTFHGWVTGAAASTIMGSLRLVYKPSDLELDCRIMGDTDALRSVPGFNDFPGQSLVEIVNGLIAQEKRADPKSKLTTLPTYRILPRYRTSTTTGTGQYPVGIRNAYGYIEFLQHEYAPGLSMLGYYPFGTSDYVLFPSQLQGTIVADFYRQLGQLVALARLFSFTDLHGENVRVRGYRPYFIDLELSLTALLDGVDGTGLFGGSGGVTGVAGPDELTIVSFVMNKPKVEQLEKKNNGRKTFENRLLALTPTQKRVAVHGPSLVDGAVTMLRLVAKSVAAFDGWFAQLGQNVLARVLPFVTGELQTVRDQIFLNTARGDLATTVDAAVAALRAERYKLYKNDGGPKEPTFFTAQPGIMAPDYRQFDIPVFYRRIDALDIVDSNGNKVPVGATVMDSTGQPVEIEPPFTRSTYYAAAMTGAIKADLAQIAESNDTIAAAATSIGDQVAAQLTTSNVDPKKPDFAFEDIAS